MNKISIPTITLKSGHAVSYCPGHPQSSSGGQSTATPPSPDPGGGNTPPSETILTLPYIETTYDVKTATSATKVLYSSHFINYGIDRMMFDGEEHPSATSFRFSTIGEHKVRVVTAVAGNTAYYGCTQLTKVVIPTGITRIGEQAFRSCSILRDITLPDTITTVGVNAFDSFSDGIIRINGQLTDTLRSIITKYFTGCKLYINGRLTPGIL